MINIPEVKVGIVAVSRDCFPESLSVNRRKALIKAYTDKYDAKDIYECPICIVESEIHMEQALADIKAAGCDALCVYLGNFGPEISRPCLQKYFDESKMFVAAAEESQEQSGSGTWRCILRYVKCKLQLKTSQCWCLHSGISGWRCRGLRRYDSRLFTDCKSSRRTCKLKKSFPLTKTNEFPCMQCSNPAAL